MPQSPVREIMTQEVLSIAPDLKVDVAIETMRANSIRRLPILSSTGRVIGIITLEDARVAMPKHGNFMESADEVPLARDVMTDYVYTIGPDAKVGRAAQMMVNHKVGALPVVEDHKLLGIVTESDLFRYLAAQYEEERDQA